jgi:DNA-binding NtrC family response regulator
MGIKVFYVDDEAGICELFEELFSTDEVTVVTFTDPFLALEAILQSPPDILFTDYRMPGLNGVELAKKTDPMLKKILISGENNVVTDFKFDAVLTKPMNTTLIREIIVKGK